MTSKVDPQKLSPEELLNEWSIREEELRLQNEQLKISEQKMARDSMRFQQIFQYVPMPIVLLDVRAFVKDMNLAALNRFPVLTSVKNFYLPRVLDQQSGRIVLEEVRSESGKLPTSHTLALKDSDDRFHSTFIQFPNDDVFQLGLTLVQV